MQIKKLNLDAYLPTRAHPSDAGLDFYSPYSVEIENGLMVIIPTGIAIALPENTVGLVLDRSSMGKNGIKVLGGIIDANYRGEIFIGLANVAGSKYTIKRGDKIAQLVIMPVFTPELELVEELDSTDRGEKRFGSSGR